MEEVQKKIEEEVKGSKVVVFMKGNKNEPQCGFSAAVVDVFKILGEDFKDIDVLQDNNIREGVKKYTNWPTIPQVFVDGKFIGGCDIVREMFQSGELQKVVKGE